MSGLRVLIALDPAAPREESLEALLALDQGELEITGLFVEDDALLRLASLPCAREVSTAAVAAPLDTGALHRQLDRRARSMQRSLLRASSRRDLRLEFSVRRGNVTEEVLAAASGAQVLVIGRSLRSAGWRSWLGAPPERLLERRGEAPSILMFVHEPWATGSSVLVYEAPGDAGDRTLELGRALARREGLRLVLVSREAGAALPAGVDARVLCAGPDAGALRTLCLREDARALLLPDPAGEAVPALGELLSSLPASLLVVR